MTLVRYVPRISSNEALVLLSKKRVSKSQTQSTNILDMYHKWT